MSTTPAHITTRTGQHIVCHLTTTGGHLTARTILGHTIPTHTIARIELAR